MTKNNPPQWAGRHLKAYARDAALSASPKRAVLTLAGWDENANDGAFCIQQGMKSTIFNNDTNFQIVERKIEYANCLKEKMRTCNWKGTVYRGELKKYKIIEPLDYCYLDFLGTINKEITIWMINELTKNLINGADVSITVGKSMRGNKFIKDLSEKLYRSPFISRITYETSKEFTSEDGTTEKSMIVSLILINCIFNKFNFTHMPIIEYSDTTPMILYRLRNLTPIQYKRYPDITEIIEFNK